MVTHIKKLSVERKKWLNDGTFKDGVALCQSIPGATAMQTAAYVGLKTRGLTGALLAYIGFGLPAFILMLVLSAVYLEHRSLPQVASLFTGLQVIVVAIVAHSAYSFGRGGIKNWHDIFIMAASAGLLLAGVNPFAVIAASSVFGALFFRKEAPIPDSISENGKGKSSMRNAALLTFAFAAALFILSLFHRGLAHLALTMLKVDLFAFGGGFASVPLMFHEIVTVRGWMDSKTFMDGIALGQVTPGPIVITSTFAGYLIHGIAGAFVATVAIFTPSFLLVIAITPAMDRLKTSAYFLRATKGILASFVGLLFFVTVKFALAVPWDIVRVVLVGAAFAALVKKVDILYVVLAGAAVSLLLF
jgi:chromate transporter